ncbi:hypothetical protein SIPHO067v1_p0093 [Vibrio phage 51E28.1]|nr:hypothetical protein SIPHO068v1_p0006 [Vibrio phage 51E28.4]QZI92933.1 hypothetical protein SIPHO067v1_p0093 [Vibrio phage 51E28.1]
MTTKQELTIHGVKVLRPEPTNPDSLRCRLGFHNMVQFAWKDKDGGFIYNQYPEYCTRCNELILGLKIPQRPTAPPTMPKVKPAKVDRDLNIEHAKELLRANGYVVYSISDRGSYTGNRAEGGEIKSVETYTVGENGPRTHHFMSPDNKVHTVKHPSPTHFDNAKPADAAKFASHEPITCGHQPKSTKEPTPPGDE